MKNRDYVENLKSEYIKHKNLSLAVPMAKYLKNKFELLGLKAPMRKEINKTFFKAYGLPEIDQIEYIAETIWNLPEREFQYFAINLLDKESMKKVDIDRINLYKRMIESKSWWDTVDSISSLLVGKFFTYYPELLEEEMQKWNNSNNMWLIRSSIIFQLKYKKNTKFELLSKYIKKHTSSKEFFIQKAIGWALREYSKSNPEFVIHFVEENKLMPLSHREALKHVNKNII